MSGKYDFAEQALRSRFLNAKEEIGTRAIQKGLSEILSIHVPPRVSEDEARIFEMLCCIMYSENRKWLSITQVALPYDQLVGDKAYRELRSSRASDYPFSKILACPTVSLRWSKCSIAAGSSI